MTTQSKKEIEDIPNQDVPLLTEDIKLYGALESLAATEGGKILITSFLNDIVRIIDTITTKYKTLPHTEMIALSAELSTKIDTLRTLKRSAQNKDDAKKALEEALSE